MIGFNVRLETPFDSPDMWDRLSKGVAQLGGVNSIRAQCELGALISEGELSTNRKLTFSRFGHKTLDLMCGMLDKRGWSLVWTNSRSAKTGGNLKLPLTEQDNDDMTLTVSGYLQGRLGERFICGTMDNEPQSLLDRAAAKRTALVKARDLLVARLKAAGIRYAWFCRHGANDASTIEEECRRAMRRNYFALTANPNLTPETDCQHVYIDPAWGGPVVSNLAMRVAGFQDCLWTEVGLRGTAAKNLTSEQWGTQMGQMARYMRDKAYQFWMYSFNAEPEFSRWTAPAIKAFNQVVG